MLKGYPFHFRRRFSGNRLPLIWKYHPVRYRFRIFHLNAFLEFAFFRKCTCGPVTSPAWQKSPLFWRIHIGFLGGRKRKERNGKERKEKGNETKRSETQREGTYLGTSASYLGSLALDLGTFGPELGTFSTYLGGGGWGGGMVVVSKYGARST